MKNLVNKRRFSRSSIEIAVKITSKGFASFDAIVVDMSMNGIQVETDKCLPEGTACEVDILIGHYKHELPLVAKGKVVRSQNRHIAIFFDSIGVGGSEEIQSMLLFHADDPEQCLHELEEAGITTDT